MVNNNSFPLQRIERPPRLSEQVESQLFDAIQKSVFSHGDYLPSENELTRMFDVSRAVIREALLRLSARGIVDIQKGKGAQVLKPSIDSVLDPFSRFVNYKCGNEGLVHIVHVRQMLEPEIASLAAKHRKESDLIKLQQSVLELKRSGSNKVKMSHWDIVFHETLSQSCENPVLPIVIHPLYDVLAKFHWPIFNLAKIIDVTIAAHEEILDAVEKRDAGAARIAMEAHLKVAEEHSQSLMEDKKPVV